MEFTITPRSTFLLGICLALVGGLLIIVSTDALIWLNQALGNGLQTGIYVVSAAVGTIRLVALPLGIGLVCTSVAMAYFDQRTSKTTPISLGDN